jgi:NADH-quinone oxidoreductase subunit A
MFFIIEEYFQVFIFLFFSILLSLFLLFLGLKVSPQITDFEKISAYECGFIPLGDARQPFHVRFYLVGVLFLLFDLEMIYLFPCVLYIQSFLKTTIVLIHLFGFFLFLIVGVLYELIKGALD